MKSNELCLSEQSVAIDGAVPAPGDEIELTVKAKVSRVEGGKVYATPTEANGEPIMTPEESGERPGEEPLGEDELREMARQQDEQDQASITA